jgi:hypothetical protein
VQAAAEAALAEHPGDPARLVQRGAGFVLVAPEEKRGSQRRGNHFRVADASARVFLPAQGLEHVIHNHVNGSRLVDHAPNLALNSPA